MTELVLLRAPDDASLVMEAHRIIGYLDRVGDVPLLDVAYSCTFTEGPSVLAVVADSTADLRKRLSSAADRIGAGSASRIRDKSGTYWYRDRLLGASGGKLAFVYPGVMSFYPDMLRDIVIAHPECRGAFDELEEALKDADVEFVPSNFIFPPASYYRHDADVFKSGAYAQAMVATYAGCVALDRLLTENGINPDGLVGFAGGDLAVMTKSGAVGKNFGRKERMLMIRDIYTIINKGVAHGGMAETIMVSVLLRKPDEADGVLASLPEGSVTLAIDFSPRQKTYAVAKSCEAQVMNAFAAAGIRTVKLALDRPFNTAECKNVVPAIRKFADRWLQREPFMAVYSCATASQVPGRVRKMRAEIAERWMLPVMFGDTIRKMYDDGYRVFLEVGPRGLMTTAIEDTLNGYPFAAMALNSIHRSGRLQLQHAVAQLAALGGNADIYKTFMRRGARKIDFDSDVAIQTRRESEMRLSRAFPRLSLLGGDGELPVNSAMDETKGRGARAAQRAAVQIARERRQRQFDFGASTPLVSDADMLESSPGVSVKIHKCLKLSDYPFVGDFALGSSQLSYSDPNLKGLVLLSIPLALEIMAEVATMLAPGNIPVAIEGFVSRQHESFVNDEFDFIVRAERKPGNKPNLVPVRVQLFKAGVGNGDGFVSPIMESTVVLGDDFSEDAPLRIEPLSRPRTVHWTGRDIYPSRLCFGSRLRGIESVEQWSESGLDYEVAVPHLAGCVAYTQFPLWNVNPLLLQIIVSGYALWRSHEQFSIWRGRERVDDSYSFPFKMRRLDLLAPLPKGGTRVKCYLRLTSVTPNTLLCDIAVSDGNGSAIMNISGWEEFIEHINSGYRSFITQPATSFITRPFEDGQLGAHHGIDVSSAYVTDLPYPIFERNGEVWLKMFSSICLTRRERTETAAMTGSAARRTEWLFGRIAVKEAVRRYLKDYHQARWSDADIGIYADDQGKPHAIGEWQDHLSEKIDVAIAHTAQFVVAIAAANACIGVDVESVSRDLSDEFTLGVFSPSELELAAASSNAAQSIIRFWCAKEALSKALGTGIRYSPKEMVVTRYDLDREEVKLVLEGAWENAFRALKGREIAVSVRTLHGHALSFCFLSRSLLNHAQ